MIGCRKFWLFFCKFKIIIMNHQIIHDALWFMRKSDDLNSYWTFFRNVVPKVPGVVPPLIGKEYWILTAAKCKIQVIPLWLFVLNKKTNSQNGHIDSTFFCKSKMLGYFVFIYLIQIWFTKWFEVRFSCILSQSRYYHTERLKIWKFFFEAQFTTRVLG